MAWSACTGWRGQCRRRMKRQGSRSQAHRARQTEWPHLLAHEGPMIQCTQGIQEHRDDKSELLIRLWIPWASHHDETLRLCQNPQSKIMWQQTAR